MTRPSIVPSPDEFETVSSYFLAIAGEFIVDPEYLGVALRAAPSDWRHKNVQFVLGTRIIDGTPGPPRVLATHFW